MVVANPLVYHRLAIPVEECAAACLSELMWWCGGAQSQPKISNFNKENNGFFFFLFFSFSFLASDGQSLTTVALCAFTTAGPMKASRLNRQQRVDSFDKFNIVTAFQRF